MVLVGWSSVQRRICPSQRKWHCAMVRRIFGWLVLCRSSSLETQSYQCTASHGVSWPTIMDWGKVGLLFVWPLPLDLSGLGRPTRSDSSCQHGSQDHQDTQGRPPQQGGSPRKVVNVQYSDVQDREMVTGRHMVRDVSCKNCNSKLGWMYEFAIDNSQRYKEGRVILERALVRESEGFKEYVPSDSS
ncbi:uncharacterized protein LOC132882995 isoform X1 [Neoarius graeffei]|uniref:uncharacterized protein LOC132882995 isoform X1 n=1 Tax=Neoarius graeffei TaxID=443677 RepID=UPI00298D1873|nr:uncharacterized protein LOC132882995 isoform X1 [Neoarius graeffei]